jgi:ribosomal protein L31
MTWTEIILYKETINNFEILKNIDIINLVHPAYFNHNREVKMIEGQINKIKKVVEKYG